MTQLDAAQMAAAALSNPLGASVPEKPKTHIALLVDCSGSMSGIMPDARKAALDQFNTIQREAVVKGLDIEFDLWQFAGVPRHLVHSSTGDGQSSRVRDAIGAMQAGGGTPLMHCALQAAERIDAAMSRARGDAAMIIIVTDGGDTDGTRYANQFRELANRSDIWSMAIVGPPCMLSAMRRAGVPEGNLLAWDGSREELVNQVAPSMRGSTTTYLDDRSMGVTRTTHYFTSNLASPAVAVALNQCPTVQVKSYPVTAEGRIDETVELKSRRRYVLGTAFYQLTKPEKIQAAKEILIARKDAPTVVYGGPQTRAILGLVPGDEARVKPGNHADYDVFVQSTSANRKLVRGTRVLVKV